MPSSRLFACRPTPFAVSRRVLSSTAVIRRGAEETRLLASSASRSETTVAGKLWERISFVIAPMAVNSYSAVNEPTIVSAAANPKAQ